MLQRGANNIYHYSTIVQPEDIQPFLVFCHTWAVTVEEHHHTEGALAPLPHDPLSPEG